jgi:transglutaminase-like putative cysteine protease
MTRERDQVRLATELALAGVTAAAVVGMHRLFADGSFRGPLLLQVALAHLCVAVLRHLRVRLALAGLITLGAGLVAITVTQFLDTAWVVLPSPETFSAIQNDVDGAWSVFQQVQAPAPVEPGFVVTTSIAVWVIAFIADWGAFRTGVSFEALLPPATLFLFAAVLGGEGGRAFGAALFVAAAMVFVLLHRTWRQNRVGAWAMIQQRRGRWSAVGAGTTLTCIAVVVAGLVGPLLPGADSPGIIPWQDIGNEDETRIVVSPLVDIRTRMVQQPDVQVFSVRSNDPNGTYWRLTALDDFTGEIWRSSYETDDADGELPSTLAETGVQTATVTQQIQIQALAQIWLPAAYEPAAVEAEGADVDYDEASSTLIVDRDTESSDGLEYQVTSLVPTWTADQLRAAPDTYPEELFERYTRLPEGFSQRVVDEAVRLTDSASTPYDKAIALQTYLREEFEYDLNAPAGHDGNAIESFLFDTQRGYCEQFAGTFAAMMRAIGIPSRVVVGFTKGDPDPNEPGLFSVKGKHAHAWVELYFPEYGWVTFDPTPTRGIPGGEPWLNIPEGQVDTNPSGNDTSTTPPTTPATGPGSGNGGGDPSTGNVEVNQGGGGSSEQQQANEKDEGLWSSFVDFLLGWWLRLGIAAAVYAVTVPSGIAAERRLRRARARHPADRVRLAWQEVDEELTTTGLRLDPSLTVAERAVMMRRALPEMAPNIELLARAMEQVAYAETPPSSHQLELVDQGAALITAAAKARRPRWRRILSYLDARRLLPRRRIDDSKPQSDPVPASSPA